MICEVRVIKVFVIIPTYNMNESILLCLNSIKKSNFKDYEIILVDDCSNQCPFEMTKSYGCKQLRLTKRSGPGAARNRAAAIAEGEIFLFVDVDVEVEPDTIGKVAAFLEHNQNIAAVVGDYTLTPGKLNFTSVYKNLFHIYYHILWISKCKNYNAFCISKPAYTGVIFF
jgi:glycosyltransferase involved in cell wall biosynthesis